jgi:hypothetical protein
MEGGSRGGRERGRTKKEPRRTRRFFSEFSKAEPFRSCLSVAVHFCSSMNYRVRDNTFIQSEVEIGESTSCIRNYAPPSATLDGKGRNIRGFFMGK